MSQLTNVVVTDDGRLFTPNLAPGQRVYDEELHTIQGVEHRTWNPSKSKLGAFLVKGGRTFPFREDSRVLYLGAANGTTPSHVSDIITRGVLWAVEFSPRSYRDLLGVAQHRPNMVPILADAWRPELYERFIGKVDILFQDIAQRQQAAILAIKARSVDVARDPRDVYQTVAEEVSALSGYDVVEMVELGPFEKDHACLVLVPGGAPREVRREAPRTESREGHREERREGGFRGREERGGFQRGPPRGGGGFRDDRPRGGGGFRDDRPRGGGGGFRDDRRGGGGGFRDDRRGR